MRGFIPSSNAILLAFASGVSGCGSPSRTPDDTGPEEEEDDDDDWSYNDACDGDPSACPGDECEIDSDCPCGGQCDFGYCRDTGCCEDYDCGCGNLCVSHACVEGEPVECCYNEHCEAGQYCNDGSCAAIPCPPLKFDRDTVFIGGTPTGLVLADLDGDGDLDLAFADPGQGRVLPVFNDGVGQFTYVPAVEVGSAEFMSITAGDLDGDGGADLVISKSSPDEIVVLIGAGWNFAPTVVLPQDAPVHGSAIGQLDGDGLADFVGVDTTGQFVVAWYGDGLGGLAGGQSLSQATGAGALVADIDADTFLDVVGPPPPGVLAYGDGVGGFVDAPALSDDEAITRIHLADVDGSGEPDIIASRALGNGGGLLVWLRQADEWVVAPSVMSTPLQGGAFGDLDSDLDLDFVSATSAANVKLLVGDGDGRFKCEQVVKVAESVTTPELLAVGDLNGDGKAEIVVGAPDFAVVMHTK